MNKNNKNLFTLKTVHWDLYEVSARAVANEVLIPLGLHVKDLYPDPETQTWWFTVEKLV